MRELELSPKFCHIIFLNAFGIQLAAGILEKWERIEESGGVTSGGIESHDEGLGELTKWKGFRKLGILKGQLATVKRRRDWGTVRGIYPSRTIYSSRLKFWMPQDPASRGPPAAGIGITWASAQIWNPAKQSACPGSTQSIPVKQTALTLRPSIIPPTSCQAFQP